MHNVTSQMQGENIFSKKDLIRAYNQYPVEPSDTAKTAIKIPFGLFEFLHVAFGLRNATQTFHRFSNCVLHSLNFCFVYIDDVLAASSSYEEPI